MPSESVLVCYDDSTAARAAVRAAVRLFPDTELVIMSVWKRFETPRVSEMIALQPHDVLRMATALKAEAQAVARRGVELAVSLGAEATPCVVEASGSVWRTIVEHADTSAYPAVVLGARAHSALAGAMLGGVATMVVTHSQSPVTVVHAPSLPRELGIDEAEIAAQLPALGA